jgi:pimeloyl-ACP methyl ester carboxylesterase
LRDNEIREASALAGASLREVTRGVERVHRSIAGRAQRAVRSALGDVTLPVNVGSGAITRLSYAAVGVGLSGAARVGGMVWARRKADDYPAGDTAGRLLAMVNGSHGHVLAARRSPLALSTTVRRDGRDIELTADAVRVAWPDPTGQIAVYVHGLVVSEREWSAPTGEGRVAFPALLSEQLGLTPVTVRYNTGRRIQDNGRDLSAVLGELVSGWPVPVTRVVLIGHSMGGLVCHSALATEGEPVGDWRDLVSDLVTLGSPHEGSWLEQVVVRINPHLHRVPETAWLGEQIDGRSDGIRDLVGPPIARHGRPIRERAVVATVAGAGRLGRVFGDALVGIDSARGGLADADAAVINRLHHLALLHDPRVGQQLLTWLDEPGPASA